MCDNILIKEFVKYETALTLKEWGFDKPCLAYYQCNDFFMCEDNPRLIQFTDSYSYDNKGEFMIGGDCSAPLYQQAIDFLREKYHIYIDYSTFSELGNESYSIRMNFGDTSRSGYFGEFLTFHEAREHSINLAIHIHSIIMKHKL